MHLNGQHVARIEELDQQGELLPPRVTTEQRHILPFDQLSERLSGEISHADNALICPMIGDFPALCVVLLRSDRLVKHRS